MPKMKAAMTASEFRKIREKLDKTQVELASDLGYTPTQVSRWERGEAPIGKAVAEQMATRSS